MAEKHFGKTKDRHIYLSTSNQASPDDIKIVRSFLEKKGWSIIEHEGGRYNDKLLYETSMMIMVGYDTGFHTCRRTGRGQYNQLYDRESYDYNSNWMFTGCLIDGTPEFYPVVTDGVKDEDAYKRDYGAFHVMIESASISLQDYNKVGVKTPRKPIMSPSRHSWLSGEDTYGEHSKYKKKKRKLRLIRGI